jgi:cellulose synthase/poly-beta-1,6-N-acetylglucosamine synthase-like glycosyltransferase
MDHVLIVLVAVPGAVLALCTAYQLLWMVLSLPSLWRPAPTSDGQSASTRFAVLIPAHNEEQLIAETVRSLRESDYPSERCTVYVIADNCTDRTAEIAAAAGAKVLVRVDSDRRGKPYALAWAIEQITLNTYDAFVIIDGDTVVDRRFLAAMDVHMRRGAQALQGYYGVLNPEENWVTRLGVIPAAVKFRLHFPGKIAVGLSCPLAGNGMCFSRDVIARFGWNAFSLTENWEYYIILTLNGYLVSSAPEAVIYSQLVRSLKLGEPQRMRWMKGRMETLRQYFAQLIAPGGHYLRRLDAAIELGRPSYSMLFIWSMAYLVVTGVLAAFGAIQSGWAAGAALLVALQAGYVLTGVAVAGRGLATWLALGAVPFYLAWKLVVTVKGLLTIKDKTWVKTTRN